MPLSVSVQQGAGYDKSVSSLEEVGSEARRTWGCCWPLVGRHGEGFGAKNGGLARPCIRIFSRLVAPSPKLITARSQNCAFTLP
jgi:hypothetical protein